MEDPGGSRKAMEKLGGPWRTRTKGYKGGARRAMEGPAGNFFPGRRALAPCGPYHFGIALEISCPGAGGHEVKAWTTCCDVNPRNRRYIFRYGAWHSMKAPGSSWEPLREKQLMKLEAESDQIYAEHLLPCVPPVPPPPDVEPQTPPGEPPGAQISLEAPRADLASQPVGKPSLLEPPVLAPDISAIDQAGASMADFKNDDKQESGSKSEGMGAMVEVDEEEPWYDPDQERLILAHSEQMLWNGYDTFNGVVK